MAKKFTNLFKIKVMEKAFSRSERAISKNTALSLYIDDKA